MLEIFNHISLERLRSVKDDLDRCARLLGVTGLFANSSQLSRMSKTEAQSEIELKSRYDVLKVDSLPVKIPWVNHRLRPNNRPKKRVVQLAFLFSKNKLLSADCYDVIKASIDDNPKGLLDLFSGANLEDSDQELEPWKDLVMEHSGVGKARTATLVANFVLPWLFAVAETEGDFRLLHKIEMLYQKMSDRNDSITRRFLASPSKEITRLSGEGLRELYHNWCLKGKCQECDAGQYLLGGRKR